MKAFVFKPTNELIGKFEVDGFDQVPKGLQGFLTEHQTATQFSYVEVSGKTWTIISRDPLRLSEGLVKHEQPKRGNTVQDSRPKQSSDIDVGRAIRMMVGFIVGSGVVLFLLALLFEGMNSGTGRHYSPRGGGWFLLIVGAGVGCAGLFARIDLRFITGLPVSVRVMIAAPLAWVLLVLSFVWVFQPFGSYVSDGETWLVTKIAVFPIVAGFLAYLGYRLLFKSGGKTGS